MNVTTFYEIVNWLEKERCHHYKEAEYCQQFEILNVVLHNSLAVLQLLLLTALLSGLEYFDLIMPFGRNCYNNCTYFEI